MQFCKPLQHILLQGATKLVCYCIVQGLLLTTGRCGQLKPCQNKKGQSFVVMLDFCMSFFEFASAACCKKRHAKAEQHNKRLAVPILSELYEVFNCLNYCFINLASLKFI